MKNQPTKEALRQKLDTYQASDDAIQLIRDTNIMLLVGVSGAGKDTVKHELLKNTDTYHHIVSHTTRQLRENKGVMEQNGVEYHFIDTTTAVHMLDNGGFIEAKIYSGNLYGTSVGEIRLAHDEGKVAITDVEVHGVAEFHKISPGVKAVFILPPSFAIWQERLYARYAGQQNAEDLQRRLRAAEQELRFVRDNPYFYLVINDALTDTVAMLEEIANGTLVEKRPAAALQVIDDILAHLQEL